MNQDEKYKQQGFTKKIETPRFDHRVTTAYLKELKETESGCLGCKKTVHKGYDLILLPKTATNSPPRLTILDNGATITGEIHQIDNNINFKEGKAAKGAGTWNVNFFNRIFRESGVVSATLQDAATVKTKEDKKQVNLLLWRLFHGKAGPGWYQK